MVLTRSKAVTAARHESNSKKSQAVRRKEGHGQQEARAGLIGDKSFIPTVTYPPPACYLLDVRCAYAAAQSSDHHGPHNTTIDSE